MPQLRPGIATLINFKRLKGRKGHGFMGFSSVILFFWQTIPEKKQYKLWEREETKILCGNFYREIN